MLCWSRTRSLLLGLFYSSTRSLYRTSDFWDAAMLQFLKLLSKEPASSFCFCFSFSSVFSFLILLTALKLLSKEPVSSASNPRASAPVYNFVSFFLKKNTIYWSCIEVCEKGERIEGLESPGKFPCFQDFVSIHRVSLTHASAPVYNFFNFMLISCLTDVIR